MHCFHSLLCFWVLLVTTLTASDGKLCETEMCKRFADRLKENIDECADPCEDFSAYICGKFDQTHKIPAGRSSASTFDDIEDDITATLKGLLESQPLLDENLPQTKAGIYYRSCLNKTQRNKLSKEPILDFISELNKERNYNEKLRKLLSYGLTSRMFGFYADQDSKNPEYYILNIVKPSLIMTEMTLQIPEEREEKKQIESYKRYMNKILDLLGLWKEDRSVVDRIVDLNIQISKFLPTMTEQQDPELSYNKVKIGELEERCSYIPWKKLINDLLKGTNTKLCSSDNVLIFSLSYVDHICKLFNGSKEVKEVMDLDLIWAGISSLVKYGSEEFTQASDEYDAETLGVVGKEEPWKTCVTDTSETMVEVVGNMYVKENFHAASKKDAEDMLLNVRNALKGVIIDINWMDNATKEMALLKLDSIDQKIGYSEKILNETYMKQENEKLKMDIERYIHNKLQCGALEFVKSVTGVGQKSPKDKWLMGPQQVNAYYNPTGNEIVFPAAIFRFPFYDISFPVTSNYGGIGTFIGHEILHGFDTSGSKFDNKGFMREWWTKETRSKYTEKAQCIINQYGNYTMYGKNLPSDQTIGEDIADNAGIRMAFKGSQTSTKEKTTLPGLDFTSEQLYFVNQAMTWCSHFTKESVLEKMKSDEHTIWKFRINGPLSNMPEFSKAFNCSHEKKMNRLKKCIVW